LNFDKIITLLIEELKILGIRNYALVKDDGSFYKNNFNKSAQKIISKLALNYQDLPVNNYIRQQLVRNDRFLYLFKIAFNGFIVFVSSIDSHILLEKLKLMVKQYGFYLYQYFKTQNGNIITELVPKFAVSEPISTILLAKNKDYIPEPIAWIPSNLSEVEALKIANKALLLILGDTDEIKECYSLIHFIKLKKLGLVYLFEIPNRIKLASATLTILFNENVKREILLKIESIETEIKTFLDKNRRNFDFSNEKLKILHDIIISVLNKPILDREIITPPNSPDSEHALKETMIREVKRLRMPKKVEKKFNKSNLKSEMVRVIKKVKNQV